MIRHAATPRFAIVLAGAVALWAGCGRAPPPPPVPEGAPPVPVGPPERRGPDVAHLVDRVRHGPCGPGGEGYARWIEEELVRAGGTLMFSDWHALTRDETADEVWFTYSLLDADYRVLVGAYAWEVRRPEGQVGAPRRIEPRARTAGPARRDEEGR